MGLTTENLETLIEEYLAHLTNQRRLLPTSLQSYEFELRRMASLLKDLSPTQIAKSLSGLAPATARRKWMIWGGFLKFHKLDRELESWPQQLPKLRQKLPRFLTEAEAFRLESACYRSSAIHRDRLLVAFGLQLGLRLAEMRQLRFSDIEGSWVRILRKGAKEVRLPLTPSLQVAIQFYRSEQHATAADFIFMGRRGPLSARAIQKILERLGRLAGIENLHPHCLRHSFATRLASRGASLVALKELMGHQSLATTERYLHVTPEHLRETLGLLSPLAAGREPKS